MSPKLKNLFLTLLALISCALTYGGDKNPPAPTRDPTGIPPPVGLPIDDYIPLLLVLGILMGVWIKSRIAFKSSNS